jgi:hypothetical protein
MRRYVAPKPGGSGLVRLPTGFGRRLSVLPAPHEYATMRRPKTALETDGNNTNNRRQPARPP